MELQAESYGCDPTSIAAEIEEFGRRERWRRAAKSALPLLAGALLSLPIPGWHLVGVPGFLIAAVLMGRSRLRTELEIRSLRGPCPACREVVELPPPSAGILPCTVPCSGCGEFLSLSVR